VVRVHPFLSEGITLPALLSAEAMGLFFGSMSTAADRFPTDVPIVSSDFSTMIEQVFQLKSQG